jgi:phosphatidylinositol alpha-1,6-mannosyltransferase
MTAVIAYGIDTWVRLPWLRRVALQRADLVIAISRFTAERATRMNELNRGRVNIVYGCLDPSLSGLSDPVGHPDHERSKATTTNSLLTVSRLSLSEASKGHVSILRSLPGVLASIPTVMYDVVGDGDLKPELQRLSVELGIADHVRFLGTLSDQNCAASTANAPPM